MTRLMGNLGLNDKSICRGKPQEKENVDGQFKTLGPGAISPRKVAEIAELRMVKSLVGRTLCNRIHVGRVH